VAAVCEGARFYQAYPAAATQAARWLRVLGRLFKLEICLLLAVCGLKGFGMRLNST